jgi:hypothetical protein
MVPKEHKGRFSFKLIAKLIQTTFEEMGDPANDLVVATVLLLVGGRLVLLRPRKVLFYSFESKISILIDLLVDRVGRSPV